MKIKTQILTAICLFCFGLINAQNDNFTAVRLNSTPASRPTLTGFTGSEKNNIISLSWSTAGEKNSSHFIIERSSDGLEFDSLGAVTALGRFRLPTTYNFEDLQPNSGTNYYRVKIGIGGRFVYTEIVSVIHNGSTVMPLYPNPVQKGQQIHYLLKEPVTASILQITDITGRMMGNYTVQSSGFINIRLWSSGMYLYRLLTASGAVVATGKIKVQ